MASTKNIIIVSAVILVAAAVLVFSLAGTKSDIPPVGSIKEVKPHEAPSELKGEALRKKIYDDFIEDVKLWQSDNPHDYRKALTGRALQQLEDIYGADLKAGKIKVRVHKDIKAEVKDLQFDTAQVAYKFTDASYYIDAETKKAITKPLNVTREWNIGLTQDKANGQWKITVILGAPRKHD
jgi:hypothetical protein